MRTKPFKIVLLATTLLLIAAAAWTFTAHSATWRLQRIFPEARVYFDPVNSPALTFSTLVRFAFPSYVEMTEDSIGFELSDCPEPIDFSRLVGHGFHLHSIRLTRCRITDLRPLESLGKPFVVFTDCDFSSLPDSQQPLLSTYDPNAPEPNRKLAYSSP